MCIFYIFVSNQSTQHLITSTSMYCLQQVYTFLAACSVLASAQVQVAPATRVLDCKLQILPGSSIEQMKMDYGCIDIDDGSPYRLVFPDDGDAAPDATMPHGTVVRIYYSTESSQGSEPPDSLSQDMIHVVAWERVRRPGADENARRGKGHKGRNGGKGGKGPPPTPAPPPAPTPVPTMEVVRGEEITAVVVVVRYVDASGTFPGVLNTTAATVLDAAKEAVWGLGGGRSTSGLLAAHSYGSVAGIAFDAANVPAFIVDVPLKCTKSGTDPFCPRDIDYDAGTACGNGERVGVATYARNKLADLAGMDPDVMFAQWTHRMFVMDHDDDSSIKKCPSAVMANLRCTMKWCESWLRSDFAHLPGPYAHNIGRNIGIGPAGSAVEADGSVKFGDLSGIMGRFCLPATAKALWNETKQKCCSTRAFNAPHLVELGWAVPLRTVDSTMLPTIGVQVTIPLNSLSIDSNISADSGPIPVSAGFFEITPTWEQSLSGVSYWVQFKTKHGYDATAENAWLNNVQIKRWNRGSRWSGTGTVHLATLGANQSWVDRNAGLRVTVLTIEGLNDEPTAKVQVDRIQPEYIPDSSDVLP
jgi:hypothetical protein